MHAARRADVAAAGPTAVPHGAMGVMTGCMDHAVRVLTMWCAVQIRSIDGADDDSDQVSPEAFSMMCPTHGITPNYPAGSGSIPGCPGFPASRSRPGSASSTRATPRAGAGSGPSYSRPRLRSSPDPTSHVSFDGSEGAAPTSARTSVTGGDADAVTVDGDEELGV